jgi:plasmid stabilization system protein ParE
MARQRKRLEWSRAAAREFIDGIAFIAADSPQGASLVKGRIDRAAGFLCQHPRLGKPGAAIGTREYPVPKTRYTLIYGESGEVVFILHCWHQSRQSNRDGTTDGEG